MRGNQRVWGEVPSMRYRYFNLMKELVCNLVWIAIQSIGDRHCTLYTQIAHILRFTSTYCTYVLGHFVERCLFIC